MAFTQSFSNPSYVSIMAALEVVCLGVNIYIKFETLTINGQQAKKIICDIQAVVYNCVGMLVMNTNPTETP